MHVVECAEGGCATKERGFLAHKIRAGNGAQGDPATGLGWA